MFKSSFTIPEIIFPSAFPESSFVAERDGQVVGYINSSLDNRRFGLVLMFIIIPFLILKGFIRGVFLRGELKHHRHQKAMRFGVYALFMASLQILCLCLAGMLFAYDRMHSGRR